MKSDSYPQRAETRNVNHAMRTTIKLKGHNQNTRINLLIRLFRLLILRISLASLGPVNPSDGIQKPWAARYLGIWSRYHLDPQCMSCHVTTYLHWMHSQLYVAIIDSSITPCEVFDWSVRLFRRSGTSRLTKAYDSCVTLMQVGIWVPRNCMQQNSIVYDGCMYFYL